MQIRKGDTVYIRSGQDKGKTGRVLHVFPKKNQLLVEGVNMHKKHQRPTQKSPKGGIVTKEAPIQYSNVAIWDAALSEPTKISTKVITESGTQRKVRISSKTGAEI
jgi:large subunit ribosomal protein L24